jgi:hypothetical protein
VLSATTASLLTTEPLATLLAVHLGFTAVLLIAMGLYLMAGINYRF